MKRIIWALAAMVIFTSAFAAKKQAIKIDNIDPPYWWIGMANDTLQLLVSGPDLAATELSVNYPGVSIVEDVKLDSPNYKLVYLTVAPDTKPGDVKLDFTLGKKKASVNFPLKKRTWKGTDNPGFDASDVLYLIMP
ncbi:MAG: cyclomaltodextrinase N-terminal domain-containing protein, partial [Muribaculaceae bacterium]|nr:cyclomaltodextrinase N-terminal domain-containing protein [Muribaculaceae bacterium]